MAHFAQNAREVRSTDLARLVTVVLLAVLAIWLVSALFLRNARKAGLLASSAVVLFFTFDLVWARASRVYRFLEWYWVRTDSRMSAPVVMIAEILLLVLFACLLKTKLKDGRQATAFLNVFSVILLGFPVYAILTVKTPSLGRPPRVPVPFKVTARPEPARLPDIYYIILDGYARTDVMKSFFDFDNTPFLEVLEHQGFYIARQSNANYCQTPLSLAASLNAVYLDDLVKGLGADQTELSDLIGKSNVLASLRPLRYKFVTFATGFDPTEHPEADTYLSPHRFASGFERMVINTTPLRWVWPDPTTMKPSDMSRERTFYVLDHLPDVASDLAPTFTLAHIFCPHPPFVFGENGADVEMKYRQYSAPGGDRLNGRFRHPAKFARAYRDQAVFITKRIEETIKQIQARSPEPPIIILQSDHGSELNLDMTDVNNTDLKKRMSILNAYYFPGQNYEGLNQRITPVNSFRVVLNTYFGANLELLPDRSFFSTWSDPYHFIDVSDQVRSPDG